MERFSDLISTEALKLAFGVIAAAVLLLFAVIVWPTLYRYDHLTMGEYHSTTPVRMNRFTGGAEYLTMDGWRAMGPKR